MDKNYKWNYQESSIPQVKKEIPKEQRILLEKMMVGHFIESIPDDCKKSVCYVLQGNGLWEVRRNKIFTFYSHLADTKIPGLNSVFEKQEYILHVPLIPSDILVKIISFFKEINKKYNSEVFIRVYLDLNTNQYECVVPKQSVSAASVNYEGDDYNSNSDKLLVFEIHSHNTMDAFFSGTDDRDEKDDRFFGVIGHIQDYFPKILIRMSVGGRKYDVELNDLFDLEDGGIYKGSIPKEWLENVNEKKYNIGFKTNQSFDYTNNYYNDWWDDWKKDDKIDNWPNRFNENEEYIEAEEEYIDDDEDEEEYYKQYISGRIDHRKIKRW